MNYFRYVDRLSASLKSKNAVESKLLKSKDKHIEKRKKLGEDLQDLSPKLQLIISRTKELQKNIEGSISKKYKNREVNLMGGVNVL